MNKRQLKKRARLHCPGCGCSDEVIICHDKIRGKHYTSKVCYCGHCNWDSTAKQFPIAALLSVTTGTCLTDPKTLIELADHLTGLPLSIEGLSTSKLSIALTSQFCWLAYATDELTETTDRLRRLDELTKFYGKMHWVRRNCGS